MWRADPRIPDAERRAARRVTLAATTLFVFLVTHWRPWQLFARGGFTTDFYDQQARAFLHLHLAVPARVAGIEGFVVHGRTYLYYGPMLALVRLPTALFGSWADGRLTRLSMVAAFVCLCTVTFHLTRRVARLVGRHDPPTWGPALLVGAVACSPALALAGRANVYHETEIWACALLIGTFVAVVDLLCQPSRRTLLIAGSGAVATVLTRASVGFGALAALALTGLLVWRSHPRVARASLGVAFGGLATNVLLNVAKFGTLLDLPAEKQVLTAQSAARAAWFAGNGGSFFSLRFLPTTLVQYLRPDTLRFERLAPFIRFGPPAHQFGSYPLESQSPAASLSASATLLVVLSVAGIALMVRRRRWQLGPLLAGASVAAAPTLAIGSIANRYLVDLLPALIVPAAAALVLLSEPAAPRTPRRLAIALVAVLTGWGVWVNTSLAVWLDGIERPGFTAWRYEVDDLLFVGQPPSVIALDPRLPVPRDGVVGISGSCDGLYIAVQGGWVPLERADGVLRLRGTFDPTAGPQVFTAAQGTLTIDVSNDRQALDTTYVSADGATVHGSLLEWDGGAVAAEVVSDPVAVGFGHGLSVTIDGTQVLYTLEAPDLRDATVGRGFDITSRTDRGTPICTRLAGRRR
jgi:hypothetical protein